MTCYVHNLKSLMERAEAPYTRDGWHAFDAVVRASLKLSIEVRCGEVWAEVKKQMAQGPEWADGIVQRLAGKGP